MGRRRGGVVKPLCVDCTGKGRLPMNVTMPPVARIKDQNMFSGTCQQS